jgi:hypothetical protein
LALHRLEQETEKTMGRTNAKPWHQVVQLRDHITSQELSQKQFAADLHDMVMGVDPGIYRDPREFMHSLTQAVPKVPRCCLVASLLASDVNKMDDLGRQISKEPYDGFKRVADEGIQPAKSQDVPEILRRRLLQLENHDGRTQWRSQVVTALDGIQAIDDHTAKNRAAARGLANVAQLVQYEGRRQNWTAILEAVAHARKAQEALLGMRQREIAQAVMSAFLHSQPIEMKKTRQCRAHMKTPNRKWLGVHEWWCSSPVEETFLPHGHCHRGRDSTLVAHPRENGPPPRICSLPQAMNGRRFDPQTRNRTGQSLQSIPHATPAAVLLQMVAFGQVAEVLFQGVPADPGQLDRFGHRDAPVLPGELHDL